VCLLYLHLSVCARTRGSAGLSRLQVAELVLALPNLTHAIQITSGLRPPPEMSLRKDEHRHGFRRLLVRAFLYYQTASEAKKVNDGPHPPSVPFDPLSVMQQSVRLMQLVFAELDRLDRQDYFEPLPDVSALGSLQHPGACVVNGWCSHHV
jgi:hypothetical protein